MNRRNFGKIVTAIFGGLFLGKEKPVDPSDQSFEVHLDMETGEIVGFCTWQEQGYAISDNLVIPWKEL